MVLTEITYSAHSFHTQYATNMRIVNADDIDGAAGAYSTGQLRHS